MNLTNVIVTLILIVILGLAITYIVRQKKNGVKCIGCSYAGNCAKYGGHSCDCQDTENNS